MTSIQCFIYLYVINNTLHFFIDKLHINSLWHQQIDAADDEFSTPAIKYYYSLAVLDWDKEKEKNGTKETPKTHTLDVWAGVLAM